MSRIHTGHTLVSAPALVFWFAMTSAQAQVPVPADNQSQTSITYQIPHTTTVPTIDGAFTAEEWRDALRVELVNETFPGQNVTPPVKTEVYIMEDGEHFLAAFVASDPDPASIRAFYRDRDRAFQDDFVGFVIDTFNDERRAFEAVAGPRQGCRHRTGGRLVWIGHEQLAVAPVQGRGDDVRIGAERLEHAARIVGIVEGQRRGAVRGDGLAEDAQLLQARAADRQHLAREEQHRGHEQRKTRGDQGDPAEPAPDRRGLRPAPGPTSRTRARP